SLNRDDERTIRANFRPNARQLPLGKTRSGIDSVRVQIRVAASEFAAPQNTVVTPRDSELSFDCAEEPANVLVEPANAFRSRHLAYVPRRNVQLRQNARPMVARPMLQQALDQWTQPRMMRKQVAERFRSASRAVPIPAKTRRVEPVF